MYGYFQKMTQNAKNMYNATNFFIRQIYTGLTQDKELQPLQKEVLDINRKETRKNEWYKKNGVWEKKRKTTVKQKDKEKEIKCHLFEIPSKKTPYIDYNFLDSFI